MTPKAEALLDAVLVPYEVYGFEEALKPLVAYIEELERKAQAFTTIGTDIRQHLATPCSACLMGISSET